MDVGFGSRKRECHRFGHYTLDVDERRLARGAQPIRLAPKTYEVLVFLVRRAGYLVRKDELLAAIWPDVFVEEGILTVHVAMLRRLLSDGRGQPSCIETVTRFGYRFVALTSSSSGSDMRQRKSRDGTGGSAAADSPASAGPSGAPPTR